ncbi:calcium uptake protein 2, mitochondrial isoform X2 [Varanus komodoensis]|uniref:calcium uptake protein 2, mitochondrial isoform X2 n=1 Tax=Varanus komodoensis TaxID=61221 RepID=UPI001CF76C35|nr:calcium uptake protein 2, mitochondrial isoform X2 [Varanus komodoensis]
MYMAAISYYRGTVQGSSIFSQPLVKRFLKGLCNLHPMVRPLMPTWSLSVVLQALTRPPFEPLATIDLRLVSWKTAFLVAVTSAQRSSKLCALRVDPPFLNFHKEKVVLQMNPSFLPKVSMSFHMDQEIILPAFFPSPSNPIERSLHTLNVRHSLAFYRSRTESIRHSNRLFVKYSEQNQGFPVTPQRLSKWIVHTINLSYQLAKIDLPTVPRGHSTRAVAASSAFASGVPIEDVCRAATWATPCTFTRLDVCARQDVLLLLQSCSFNYSLLMTPPSTISADFKRAVKVVIGQELSENVLDTIFKIFDLDGDNCLSHAEFLGVLKNRMHRGLRVPQQQGVEGYWKCVKRETIKGAKEVWKQTGKSPF